MPREPFAMHMPHQILLAITAHTMPQDVILHATADIDRIDLHKPQMPQRRCHIGKRTVQTRRPDHEASCLRLREQL